MSQPRGSGPQILVGIIALLAIVSVPGLWRSLFSAGVDGKWEAAEMLALTSLGVVVSAAVLLIVAPFFVSRFLGMLAASPEWATAVLKVLDTHKVAAKSSIAALFEGELQDRAATEERVALIERRQEKADERAARSDQTIARAVELMPKLEGAIEKMTLSVGQLERVVTKVARDAEQQGRDLSHMAGLMDAHYEGPDRRHGGRRERDHDRDST